VISDAYMYVVTIVAKAEDVHLSSHSLSDHYTVASNSFVIRQVVVSESKEFCDNF